jgi:hypothetical protein
MSLKTPRNEKIIFSQEVKKRKKSGLSKTLYGYYLIVFASSEANNVN